MGALSSTVSGLCNPHDGDLTFLGRVLAQLPVDIRIGKLILMGHVFGLLDECVIIGKFLGCMLAQLSVDIIGLVFGLLDECGIIGNFLG